MKLIASVIVLAFALASANAFFFSRDEALASADGRPIDESCLAHADRGSCEFFTCFERRLPCGRDWYILRQGLYYCNKIEAAVGSFSQQAQQFLNDSRKCMMQSLKDDYRLDQLSCHDLEHRAVGAISTCFTDNAFCESMSGSFSRLFRLYEAGDLFSTGAGKVWREIFMLVRECGGNALQDLVVATRERAVSVLGEISNRFQRVFDWKKK